MAGGFYQDPELFSDELTAVFAAGSEVARRMTTARQALLDFDQFSQRFRMFCAVRDLHPDDQARQASLWQARVFNHSIANDAVVLGFRPDWKSAIADPMP
jgi:hypothetical protein